MKLYWFGSLKERKTIAGEDIWQARIGFKQPAQNYATQADFAKQCWDIAEARGYPRNTPNYRIEVVGPVAMEEEQRIGKRTMKQRGRTA